MGDDGGGDVAQLGEHLLCKQGVTGSIPVISTNLRATESRQKFKAASILRLLNVKGEKFKEPFIFG
jgi:hypothetical protein